MAQEVRRREFLKRVAAAATLSAGAASADNTFGFAEPIPMRILGRTGLRLPVLGYGGAALPKAWGNPLSQAERVELVRHAFDRGIRYYDTAGNYMESQAILGEALEDRRDRVCLAGKVEATMPAHVRPAVERSLRELRTDYLDIVQIHGTPGLEQMSIGQAMRIHAELAGLRDEGIVRSIGFSAHSYFDKALALIGSDGFDVCMLSYGYLPRGYDQVYSARMLRLRESCLAAARERDMGIIAMKVIGAGLLGKAAVHAVPRFDAERLTQLPGAAIRHVLRDERVHMLCIGMQLRTEVDANIRTVREDTAFTRADRDLLEDFGPQALKGDAMRAMRVD